MIILENVHKKFGDRVIFENLKASFNPFSLNIITGPSGSGKTTLLRMLRGEIPADAGRIRVKDKEIGKLRESSRSLLARSIAMVYQEGNLLDDRSAIENIALPLRIAGIHGSALRNKVYEITEKLEISSLSFINCGDLSGGERRLISIARALAFSPSVILLDEPLANLDKTMRKRISEFLCNLSVNEKILVIWATHDVHEIADTVHPYVFTIKNHRLELSQTIIPSFIEN
ncbi:ATP-binding cassette domain-containing protein [Myxococcota bacterium]|nr:ATP-binding cassette domain-containing protein [Myxococcota bacterium]MBU1382714.1 ATP-binding cassette domain-containing protein [Myxococcota bacterium]MBU1496010.1 ATP-binding cassette domain-containing protein [Myxococcota bacterium]